MNILDALKVRVKEKPVVSLVGGGGKTSIMYRLAHELKQLHSRVLMTTTTAICYPGQAQYDQLFLWDGVAKPCAQVKSFSEGSITVIGSRITEENKLKGIAGHLVDTLFDCGIFDIILVEADGAKRRPIKAPDHHEPVIPSCTSCIIGVIGFDCYLKEIGEDWVHRPQLLASVTGKGLGDVIDDEVFVKLVLSQNGLFKNSTREAQKVLFINKVDSSEQMVAAQRIGHSVLMQSSGTVKVVIGSAKKDNPVQTVMERAME